MLQSNINWGQYSDDRQRAYDRLADTRQRQLDAEVKAHNEKAAQGTDSQQLGALAVQGGLAYATGGASLAYAPMIDKASWTAMGKPQAAGTGVSGMASSLGQVGYGLAQGNKAETLAQADKAFERNMANQERRYKALMDAGYEEAAFDITSDMQAMDEGYQKNRQNFVSGSQTGKGFLDNMFGRGKVETEYDKYEGPRVSNLSEPVEATEPTTPSQSNLKTYPKAVQEAVSDSIGPEPGENNIGKVFRDPKSGKKFMKTDDGGFVPFPDDSEVMTEYSEGFL